MASLSVLRSYTRSVFNVHWRLCQQRTTFRLHNDAKCQLVDSEEKRSTLHKDGRHVSTSSHCLEMKPKYPAYERWHLAHLDSEVLPAYGLKSPSLRKTYLKWLFILFHVPSINQEEAGFLTTTRGTLLLSSHDVHLYTHYISRRYPSRKQEVHCCHGFSLFLGSNLTHVHFSILSNRCH